MILAGGSSTTESVSEGLPGRFSKPKKIILEGGNPRKQAKKATLDRASVPVDC